jgi:hypothetical protein
MTMDMDFCVGSEKMLASGCAAFNVRPGARERDYPFPRPAVNAGDLSSVFSRNPSVMRFLIILASILLIPILVTAHLWIYERDMKPELAGRALRELKRVGVKHANVKLDYLDATISGISDDVDARNQAAAAMHDVPGIHFADRNNLIVVPAQVNARLDGQVLTLTGWLPDEKSVQAVLKIVGDFRPDLTLETKKLGISPVVAAGTEGDEEITARHRLVRPILATLRVWPSLSIERNGDTYIMKGYLPSAQSRQSVIDAVQANPGGWKVDATGLIGAQHVNEAGFTKGDALPQFLRSYFEAPSPGTFAIKEDNVPHIVADATREMEAEWLGLLRGVSGAARVDAALTIHPSIYQLPGYRPQSEVVEGTLTPLVDALKQTAAFFDPLTNTLPPEEEAKLATVAPLMIACGPGLQLLLSGTGGAETDPPGSHHARCEVVKARLVALGVAASQMEVADLGALHSPGPSATDPQKQSSARVEMLVK